MKMAESVGKGFKGGETEAVKGQNKKKTLKLNMDFCSRQNSVNETKENNETTSPYSETKQCYGKMTYSRQTSNSPLVKGTKLPKKDSTVVDFNNFDSKESDIDNKENRTKEKCCIYVQAFTFMVSMLSLGLVTFLYYKVSKGEVSEIPQVIIGQSNHEPVVATEDKISGTFRLDQNYLKDHKEIRWTADEFSTIRPNPEEPCLTVPVAGNFLVFSRFTFKLPPGDNNTLLVHRLSLKSKSDNGDVQVRGFKRQYVSVIEHKLKEDAELRKPSVFIQFFELKAGDEVCTAVSNPDLLYRSSIDNDVNIIKV